MGKIFWLDDRLIFPDHAYANSDGIIALGGDLSVDRLLLAYSNGIFPWYNEGEPIIWWSPPKRFLLFLDEVRVGRSLKKFLKKNTYKVTFDKEFDKVIENCSALRQESGTWITREMLEAYKALYKEGYAHSVEVYDDGELVGGLYGISLGRYFCGESMFSIKKNASKVALLFLCERLKALGFSFIDCQVYTEHLERMGAREVDREEFLRILEGVN